MSPWSSSSPWRGGQSGRHAQLMDGETEAGRGSATRGRVMACKPLFFSDVYLSVGEGGSAVRLSFLLHLCLCQAFTVIERKELVCLSYTEVLPAPTFPVTTCVRSSLVQGWGPAPRICTLLWEGRCSSHRHPCFVDREDRRKARGGQGWPMGRVDWRKAMFGGVRLSHMRVPALLGSAKPPGGSQSRS